MNTKPKQPDPLPPKPTKRQLAAAMRWADPSSDTRAADMHMIQTYPLSSSVVSLSAGRILRAHILHEKAEKKAVKPFLPVESLAKYAGPGTPARKGA
jgi:hypothetical protein